MIETITALETSPLGTIQVGLRQGALELALEQALAEQDKAYAQWQLTVSKPRPKVLSIVKPEEKPKQKKTIFKTLHGLFF